MPILESPEVALLDLSDEAVGGLPDFTSESYKDSYSRINAIVIEGEKDTGVICTNGAAAHCARKGDTLIIVSFAQMLPEEASKFKPKLVYVNGENKQVDAELIDGKLVKLLG